MKVAVVGPGAMGCLFAARLAKSGIQTTLVDYRPDRAARLQKSGVIVDAADGTVTAKPALACQVPDGQHLVIVLTKAYALRNIQFRGDSPVLTLQNGLGNLEVLCSMLGSARVLAGVTCEAATLLSEGHVQRVAAGLTSVGSWTSCSTQPAVDALRKAGFEVEVTESPGQKIWEKVTINAAINPLTALLGVPNGRLLDLKEARQLMRDLVVECAKVAATEGYRFNYSLVERTEEVCKQTADNISSMLQDIRAGKRTEIDAISGEILRRAQLASLFTPRTRVVWQLVKGLEQRSM
jgi:2-dehydropantoate 2-reductase